MPILSADASLAPGSSVPAEAVSPGPIGFLWMGIIVVIVILLALDMVRRLRRTRYRSIVREQLEAEAVATKSDGKVSAIAAGSNSERKTNLVNDPTPGDSDKE